MFVIVISTNQAGFLKYISIAPTVLITGRNEVVAKVMFLLVFVILLTGGVCLSAC